MKKLITTLCAVATILLWVLFFVLARAPQYPTELSQAPISRALSVGAN